MMARTLSFVPLAVLWLGGAGCGSHAEAKTLPGSTPNVPTSGNLCLSAIAYLDADGDGYGASDSPTVACNGYVPVGYSWGVGDCNDTDSAAFRIYNHDADGDGVGAADDTICAGSEAPPGYVLEAGVTDCDDTNPAISFPYQVDADGDGFAADNAAIVCGPKDKVPPNAAAGSSYPGDCDDNDPSIRSLYYQDLDGDGFAASNEKSACGSPGAPPPGFGILIPGWQDCDDTRADVNHDALELWSDKIDSDCDGFLAPYKCNTENCDPVSSPVPIDASCASADLLITDVGATPVCYEVDWAIAVANQGTQPLSSFTLTIEGPLRTTVFAVSDPLLPGAQHSYPIPGRQLSGNVRFTVTASAPDCNPANDTLTKAALPLDCQR
jgi:Putative metal-binding motif